MGEKVKVGSADGVSDCEIDMVAGADGVGVRSASSVDDSESETLLVMECWCVPVIVREQVGVSEMLEDLKMPVLEKDADISSVSDSDMLCGAVRVADSDSSLVCVGNVAVREGMCVSVTTNVCVSVGVNRREKLTSSEWVVVLVPFRVKVAVGETVVDSVTSCVSVSASVLDGDMVKCCVAVSVRVSCIEMEKEFVRAKVTVRVPVTLLVPDRAGADWDGVKVCVRVTVTVFDSVPLVVGVFFDTVPLGECVREPVNVASAVSVSVAVPERSWVAVSVSVSPETVCSGVMDRDVDLYIVVEFVRVRGRVRL